MVVINQDRFYEIWQGAEGDWTRCWLVLRGSTQVSWGAVDQLSGAFVSRLWGLGNWVRCSFREPVAV